MSRVARPSVHLESSAAPARAIQLGARGLLRQLLLQVRGQLALACLLGTVSSAMALAPFALVFLVCRELLDSVAQARSVDAGFLLQLAAGLGIAVLLRNVLFGASTLLSHLAAFDLQQSLQARLGAKLLRVPMGYLHERAGGELRGVLLDDVEAVEDCVAHLVPEISSIVMGPLILLLAMFWLDPSMALAASAPIGAGILMVGLLVRRNAALTAGYHQSLSDMNAAATEMAAGMQALRCFNRAGRAMARVEELCDNFIAVVRRWIAGAVLPANGFIVLVGSSLLSVLVIGLWRYLDGSLSRDLLLFFATFSLGLANVFVLLAGVSTRLSRQAEVLGRIAAVLDAPELPQVLERQPLCAPPGELSLEGVSFDYGDRLALRDIHLRIPAGSKLALVGSSGAGKSTLAKLLPRFWDPSHGSVRIGGVDLRHMPSEQLHELIAFVQQETVLFRGSVAENLRLGRPDASDAELHEASRAAQADAFIRALPLGYETILGDGGQDLSGGERQRLSLARAILRDAPVLVLDEASAHADPECEAEVQKALSRLARDKTVVVIAHRLASIAHCDSIVVLDQGRIVEQGRHEELLALQGHYARLWQLQERREEEEQGDDVQQS